MPESANLALAKLEVSRFTEKDLSEFIALAHSEYGPSDATNFDHIYWKHAASPFGASTYIRLVADGKTVGCALLQPGLICTESGRFNVACVTDVIVAPAFRSPPTNFIDLTNASGNIADFSAVYHTGNNRTAPLYRKLLRFPMPISLQGYGLPVRFSGFFRKISGYRIGILDWLILPFRWLIEAVADIAVRAARLDISARLPDDDALASLCAKSVSNSGPIFARNRSFLKWRLIDAPLWAATVYCVERNGAFLGYVATRKLEFKGLAFLILVDFLLDPDLSFSDRFALRSWLASQAVKSGVDALFTMINPRSKLARICAGFPLARIPERLLPSHGMPIFVRSKAGSARHLETERATHVTFADLDLF